MGRPLSYQRHRKLFADHEQQYVLGMDSHPTAFVEVNGTFQQFEEFLNAYGIKQGDTMYLAPEDRVVMW